MPSKGFKALSIQQIYQQSGIYPEDVRSIAEGLNLGKEPFKAVAVKQIIGFSRQAREHGMTLKQAIAHHQVQSRQASETLNESVLNASQPSIDAELPAHLQLLLVESADRAQRELDMLDQIIYTNVELPAARAAVQRVLASDGNIEHLMLKLLKEEIQVKPGRLGGMVLQAVGHFRVPTLQGTEMRYSLPSSEH
jgi:(2Fe-2S) ferredoxin